MKVVMSGASGFVGRNFIENAGNLEVIPVSLQEIQPQDLDFRGAGTVLHLAACAHRMEGAPDQEYRQVNTTLTLRFAQAAKDAGVKHFVFVSTAKVYGEETTAGQVYTELSNCNPCDGYSVSKLKAEEGLIAIEDPGFKVTIVRVPLVYGKYVRANMLNLIKLVERRKIIPLGGIENSRSMVCVTNLCALLHMIIQTRQEGVFLATDIRSLSTSELVRLISVAMNKKTVLLKIPQWLQRLMRRIAPGIGRRLFGSFVLDSTLTRRVLQFSPPCNPEAGIREMVEWYMKNR